jgi:peptide-methionine (R)-S-oxide reductase
MIVTACSDREAEPETKEGTTVDAIEKVVRTEEEWKSVLPVERYRVLREKGTEPPFDNEYNEHWEDGVYECYACGLALFDSSTKFHSGTGWPSFWQPVGPEVVEEHSDTSYGMVRVEITCARCGGHLGHVFSDGPEPTGLRYCINSASLKFVPR